MINGISKKTMYEWCLEYNLRLIGLEKYDQVEFDFYTNALSEEEFNVVINNIKQEDVFNSIIIEEGKLHLKSEKYLELRMYTLVPYNLLGIQMGIQHEHSVVQNFVNNISKTTNYDKLIESRLIRWGLEWKTSILLNGGTSNEGHYVKHGYRDIWYEGSMQKHLLKLKEAGIVHSTFYEPDLNSMLTGISFIVDERVFNKKRYKDYVETKYNPDIDGLNNDTVLKWEENNNLNREKWVEKIGGDKNNFLRGFLSGFSLARG